MQWAHVKITNRSFFNSVYKMEREDDDGSDVITNLFNDDDDDPSPSAGSAKQSESSLIKYDYARTVFARGGSFSLPHVEETIKEDGS